MRRERRLTRVGKRNTVTIPAAWLHELELKPGDYVERRRTDDSVAIEKARSPIEDALGLLKQYSPGPLSDDEWDDLVQEARDAHAGERWQKYKAADRETTRPG